MKTEIGSATEGFLIQSGHKEKTVISEKEGSVL